MTEPVVVETPCAPPKAHGEPSSPGTRQRGGPATFFAVSPVKLVVMSIATFGLYEFFWFYMNWQRIKRRGMSDISPFWRTFFGFYCYLLFKTVENTAERADVRVGFSPALMAAGWIVTSFLWDASGPASFLAVTAVFFLVPVQLAMNRVNEALDPGHDTNRRFTVWNICAIIVGGTTLALAVWTGSFPD